MTEQPPGPATTPATANAEPARTVLRNGRLSMREVWAQALGALFRDAVPILSAMIGPVVVMTLVSYGFVAALLRVSADAQTLLSLVADLVLALVWFALWVGFASYLHRLFLHPQSSGSPWRAIVWTEEQTRFFKGVMKLVLLIVGMFVGLSIVSLVFGSVTGTFGVLVIGVGGSLGILVVWSRLSMVLPSAAVGRPLALGDAWVFTGQAKVRVVILFASMYAVSQVFSKFVPVSFAGAPDAFSDSIALAWVPAFISSVALFAGAAVVAAVLSATYRGLVEMRPPDARDTYVPQDGAHLGDAP